MSTDDDFIITALGANKLFTWRGGYPTFALSPELIVRIDWDVVDLSLNTIWDGCDVTIALSLTTIWDDFYTTTFFFRLSIRFRYASYLMSTYLNPAHYISSLVCVPGAKCISMLAVTTQSKVVSYSPIEWLRFTLIYLVDDEWTM